MRWNLIDHYKDRLQRFVKGERISEIDNIGKMILDNPVFDEPWESDHSAGRTYSYREIAQLGEVRQLWNGMKNMYNVYEEICREWYLPTMINAARKLDVVESHRLRARSKRRS